MARIYKRGHIWYLDYAAGGKRVRRKVGTSKKVADLALKDIEVKLAKDELGLLPVADQALDRFLAEYLAFSRTNHRQGTFRRYRAIVDNFKAFLGGRGERSSCRN